MDLSARKIRLFFTGVLALWLGLKYLLPVAMPFLLGGLLALSAEPLVGFFQSRFRMRRGIATGLGVSIALLVLLLILVVLGALLVRQLGALAEVVPDLEGGAEQGIAVLENRLLLLAEKAPGGIRPMLTRSVEGLLSDGTALMSDVSGLILSAAGGAVSRLPDGALGIGTWLLAGFMISARLPELKKGIRRRLPPAWHETYRPMLKNMKKAVLGWLSAQLRLVGITFVILLVGFFALQISYGPVWAALICLVDALPVLGTGTVLIPWSLVCFLQSDTLRAVGLLGIYAVVSLVRSVLEPRLVGKKLGLDPLITLAAMYVGYRLWGILGMLASPLLAVTLVQMLHAGRKTEG